MEGFLFGGNTGLSYEDLQRRRRQVEQSGKKVYAPKTPGQGLTALGQALAHRMQAGRLREEETRGQEGVRSAFAEILAGRNAPESGEGGAPTNEHGFDPRLAQLMGNPHASPGQKAMMQLMIQRSMGNQDATLEAEREQQRFERDNGEFDRRTEAGNAFTANQNALSRNAPTTAERNYDAAVANGFDGSFVDYQTAVRRSGANNTTINTGGTASTAFGKEFGKAGAQAFFEQQSDALDASDSLRSAIEARNLLGDGVITGFGADWALSAGKALQQAGISFNDDALANTEAFAASRAQEVGRIIQLFGAGTGLSDADREFATQAAAGKITMTQQSIERILDINIRASRNVIDRYNTEADRVGEQHGLDPRRVPLPDVKPSSPAPSSGGDLKSLSDDDLLKALGAQ